MNRDNFLKPVRVTVALRAGHLCSNPDCRVPTCGPHSDPTKEIITGQAAHICAAAKNGPRYDVNQTPEERRAITNAIWLCGNCNKKVDTDWKAWPKELLLDMKDAHEKWISAEAMIPAMPDISLFTLQHLRLNAELSHIDSAIQAAIREQELVIRNPNRVTLHYLTLDLSLPEFFDRRGQTKSPPGTVVQFGAVRSEMEVIIRGHGSATAGPPMPSTQCRVEIDKLPAMSEFSLPFYTHGPLYNETMPYSPGPMGIEFFGNPEDMEVTKQCPFNIEGTYQFELRGEHVDGTLFVPLFFKVNDRRIKSLPMQQTQEPWLVPTFFSGSGATLRVGRDNPGG